RDQQSDAEGDLDDGLPRNVARARDEPGDRYPGGYDVCRDVLDRLVEIAIELDGRSDTGGSLRPGRGNTNSTAHWALLNRSQGACWVYPPGRRWGSLTARSSAPDPPLRVAERGNEASVSRANRGTLPIAADGRSSGGRRARGRLLSA